MFPTEFQSLRDPRYVPPSAQILYNIPPSAEQPASTVVSTRPAENFWKRVRELPSRSAQPSILRKKQTYVFGSSNSSPLEAINAQMRKAAIEVAKEKKVQAELREQIGDTSGLDREKLIEKARFLKKIADEHRAVGDFLYARLAMAERKKLLAGIQLRFSNTREVQNFEVENSSIESNTPPRRQKKAVKDLASPPKPDHVKLLLDLTQKV